MVTRKIFAATILLLILAGLMIFPPIVEAKSAFDNWSDTNRQSVEFFNAGDYKKSLDSLNKALKFSPDNAITLTNIGAVYLKTGNRAEAENFFDRAVTASPNYAHAWNMRGVMYREVGDLFKAAENFRRAFDINSNDETALKNLAELYTQTDNRNVADWRQLGDACYRTKNFDKAVEFYTKAAQLKPDDANTCHGLGMIAFRSDDHDKAIAHFEKALALDPKNANSCYVLGVIYFQRDDTDKARTYLTKATELAPNEAFVWQSLGDVYYKLEDYDKAVEYFGKSFELDSQNDVVCEKLAACYDSLSRKAEAAYKDYTSSANYNELEASKLNLAAAEYRLQASKLCAKAQALGTANRLKDASEKYSPARNALQAFLNGNEIKF